MFLETYFHHYLYSSLIIEQLRSRGDGSSLRHAELCSNRLSSLCNSYQVLRAVGLSANALNCKQRVIAAKPLHVLNMSVSTLL